MIKVDLIGTHKYAYRLKFKRATVPEWVIIAMSSIGDKSIGVCECFFAATRDQEWIQYQVDMLKSRLRS